MTTQASLVTGVDFVSLPTRDLAAAMLHPSIVIHELEQMTAMAECLRRIADRYERAAKEIGSAADRYAVVYPFEAGSEPAMAGDDLSRLAGTQTP